MERDTVFWEPTAAERAETGRIVSRLQVVRAERARLEAEEARLLAGALDIAVEQVERAGAPPEWDMPVRSMAAEVAAALREGPRTVENRMVDSGLLVRDFPATLAQVEEGRLPGRHAAVIVAEGTRIGDPADRREYEARALGVAEDATVAGLKPMCRAIADAFLEESLAQRHEAARARRGVRVTALEDGMAELRLTAPVPLVQGIHDRLTTMARAVIAERDAFGRAVDTDAGAGEGVGAASGPDKRRIDELRADLACDLLLAGAPTGHNVEDGTGQDVLAQVRGTVHVTIPAHVLTDGRIQADAAGRESAEGNAGHEGRGGVGEGRQGGAGREPRSGRSDGHGDARHGRHDRPETRGGKRPSGVPTAGGEPIDPATARRLTAEATAWERLFLDPDTGALRTVDHYTPTAAQRRLLRARDEHCRFPGCRQTARRCDADHIHPHSRGGPTDVTNLESLCKRHHMLKHHSPWQVRHLGGGELEWTSPLGHHYTGRPTSGVRFTETAVPESSAAPGRHSAVDWVAG
jgi:hypothetical protein